MEEVISDGISCKSMADGVGNFGCHTLAIDIENTNVTKIADVANVVALLVVRCATEKHLLSWEERSHSISRVAHQIIRPLSCFQSHGLHNRESIVPPVYDYLHF